MPMIAVEEVLRVRTMYMPTRAWLMDVLSAQRNIIEIRIQKLKGANAHPLRMQLNTGNAHWWPLKPRWEHIVVERTIKWNPHILRRAAQRWFNEAKGSIMILNAHTGDHIYRR